jgi:lauroyl/myristoyl acyltransferase
LSKRLLGRFHVTGVFWYEVQLWYVRRVPMWMHGVAIVVFTSVFFVALTRIRRAIAANLEPVLGPAGVVTALQRSYQTMFEFARCRSERTARLAGRPRGEMTVEGREHWDRVMQSGQGVILVTAHIGAWDSATLAGIAEAQRKVHVVREEEIDPRAQAVVREQLRQAGEHYVAHFAGSDDLLGVRLLEALRRGEIVAVQGDRPHAGGRTVRVDFFGRPLLLPAGPAALARASGMPILPVFSFLERDYSVRSVVRPPIDVATTDDRESDLAIAVTRLARDIAWAVRERPHQWFCFGRIWS